MFFQVSCVETEPVTKSVTSDNLVESTEVGGKTGKGKHLKRFRTFSTFFSPVFYSEGLASCSERTAKWVAPGIQK